MNWTQIPSLWGKPGIKGKEAKEQTNTLLPGVSWQNTGGALKVGN